MSVANAVGVNQLARLTPNDLRVGLVLFYFGDSVPYVEAGNLIRKGQASGKYLLPAFRRDDAVVGGGTWTDVPGATNDKYQIVKIDVGRKGKRGKVLPDLVWITGDGYRGVEFGLNPRDVCVKFGLYSNDPVKALGVENLDERVRDELNKVVAVTDWLEKTQQTGW